MDGIKIIQRISKIKLIRSLFYHLKIDHHKPTIFHMFVQILCEILVACCMQICSEDAINLGTVNRIIPSGKEVYRF
jgi:hypothetical protein